ncbi:hypothetical protein MMC22_010381 [Lobaria immixta]|nr:hypothetical protein [Lobaria immixta]
MELADYSSVEVKPVVYCMPPQKEDNEVNGYRVVYEPPDFISGQADEDIDADNIDFYGSCTSESSYKEDTTDYTSTWTTKPKPAENPKAEYLAQFSEENHRSQAAKPSFAVSSPEVTAENKADFLTNWLEVSAQIHGQENVACGSVGNQAATSSDVEVDTQSKTLPSLSEEVELFPLEKPISGYPETFTDCDHIDKPVAEENTARKAVSVGLCVSDHILRQKTDFQATGGENLKDMSEGESERGDNTAEIPWGDLDRIPLVPGFNEYFYGSFAIAVGHKAFQLADWVSSRFW